MQDRGRLSKLLWHIYTGKETGDISGVGKRGIDTRMRSSMNTYDLLCVGATGPMLSLCCRRSSREQKHAFREGEEVIAEVINRGRRSAAQMRQSYGVEIYSYRR